MPFDVPSPKQINEGATHTRGLASAGSIRSKNKTLLCTIVGSHFVAWTAGQSRSIPPVIIIENGTPEVYLRHI